MCALISSERSAYLIKWIAERENSLVPIKWITLNNLRVPVRACVRVGGREVLEMLCVLVGSLDLEGPLC